MRGLGEKLIENTTHIALHVDHGPTKGGKNQWPAPVRGWIYYCYSMNGAGQQQETSLCGWKQIFDYGQGYTDQPQSQLTSKPDPPPIPDTPASPN